jgi:hypothetical protein
MDGSTRISTHGTTAEVTSTTQHSAAEQQSTHLLVGGLDDGCQLCGELLLLLGSGGQHYLQHGNDRQEERQTDIQKATNRNGEDE